MKPIDEKTLAGIQLASAIAPSLRKAAEDSNATARKVTTVDRDGKPVRQLSLADVTRGILDTMGVAFDPADGVRPERVLCKECGTWVSVPKRGKVPNKLCKVCKGKRERQKYEEDAPAARLAFFRKMLAIARAKDLPDRFAVRQYVKRYGERPNKEWIDVF